MTSSFFPSKRVFEEAGVTATTSLGLNLAADISNEDADIAAKGEQLLYDALKVRPSRLQSTMLESFLQLLTYEFNMKCIHDFHP